MQTVYETQELYDLNSPGPDITMARQISETLDDHGIDHEVYFDFPPVSVSTQTATCSDNNCADVSTPSGVVDDGRGEISVPSDGETQAFDSAVCDFKQYVDQDAPMVAADSNLLLTAANGGGCASIGGNYAVAGAEHITHDVGIPITRGSDRISGNISGALHEVGHNMGWGHDASGMVWNADGYWHRTPFGPDGRSPVPDQNHCGAPLPDKEADETMDELYFWDCTIQGMQIVDKPPLDDGGGGTNPPSAAFDVDRQDLSVWADGSPSSGGGGITDYQWDFGDGSEAAGINVSHTYSSAGTYTITLTVGSPGGTDSSSQTVTVSGGGGGENPTNAEFSASVDGLDLFVDGSPSHGGGGITSYEWGFGDGGFAVGETASHTYDAPGTYEVELFVTGSNGTNDATTRDLTVFDSGNGNGGNGGNGDGGNGDGDNGGNGNGGNGGNGGGGGDGGRVDLGVGEVATAGGLAFALLFAVDEETRERILDRF